MGSQNGKQMLTDEDLATLSQSSGLEENRIIEIFNGFMLDNPTGKMGPQKFRELISHALPKKDVYKMEKHVFRIYDSNKDGFIEFKEFMLVFHIMSEGSNEEVLRRIFRMFDVNGDGTISKREMTKLIEDMCDVLKKGDPNNDVTEMIAQSAFTEMDKDNNGKITETEFVQSCMEQKDFSKMLSLKIINILVEEEQ
eukprot:GFUD01116044.1.p1 GENE.GFUD01116044.1~~GFUD01116044.1.p1  ORF type:complete len:196 (-),score=63.77 GFUD01116044.1:92-679(-)